MTVALLRRRVGPVTKKRISRFGIELECLTPDDARGDDEWVSHDCDCPHCNFDGEYESSNGSEAWRQFMSTFHNDGLIPQLDDLCDYHCHCPWCDYGRADSLMTAQEDGTVGVEFVSRILDANQPYDVEAVEALVNTYATAQRRSGWVPDGGTSNGNHIHVSKHGDDSGGKRFNHDTVWQAWHLTASLFAVGRWQAVADGGCSGGLRDYNGSNCEKSRGEPITRSGNYYGTSWLANKSNTVEYRLWNTPATPARIKAHVGLSVGIQRWAVCQVITQRERLGSMVQSEFEEIICANFADVAEVILDAVPDPFRDESQKAIALWVPS